MNRALSILTAACLAMGWVVYGIASVLEPWPAFGVALVLYLAFAWAVVRVFERFDTMSPIVVSFDGGVVHGDAGGTARPVANGPVLWMGSGEPANARAGDVWADAGAPPTDK